jgi:regulator of sirC expression with transglutaminase-like and TPR domain
MLGNLRRIFLNRGELADALATVDLLLVLEPDSPGHLRIRAHLYERLECFGAALEDLRRYAELAPGAARSEGVGDRIARLARRVAAIH